MLSWMLLVVVAGCGDVISSGSDENTTSTDEALKTPRPLNASDFRGSVNKASIRATQPWLDNSTFDVKWAAMLKAPIEFWGGSDAFFHSDLGTVSALRIPGAEGLCHGDPKFDNFGWNLVEGRGNFSDNDFDDAGYCPVAIDVLRYLVATDLWFNDAALNAAALNAYIKTLGSDSSAVEVDGSTEPSWQDVRAKGLAKTTSGDSLLLGGEVQAATPDEVTAIRTLSQSDPRFPHDVLDVARDVRTSGGSAGMRRFWLLARDATGVRTVLELKELGTPGTEAGPHSQTIDGPNRFDVLKPFWWHSADVGDHFQVTVMGARFLVRDRFIRANPNPVKMTSSQVNNMVQAESSLLAQAHRAAWGKVKSDKLAVWLRDSAATVSARWRTAYSSAGGK